MAWRDEGRQRVFYVSVRKGDTVRRVYLGAGPLAHATAKMIERRRLAREQVRGQLDQEEQLYQSAISPLLALNHLTDGLVGATMLDAGYHRHDRSDWRRIRTPKKGDLSHGRQADDVSPGTEDAAGAGSCR